MSKKGRSRSRSRARASSTTAARTQAAPRHTEPSSAAPRRTERPPANRPRKVPPPSDRGGEVRQGIRRGLGRPIVIGIVAVVILGGYYGYLWLQSRKPPGPLAFASPTSSLSPRADLPGLQNGPPPWDASLGSLRVRLSELGLPALPSEVTDLHFHLHLDVLVDGKPVPVPDDIGRNEAAGYITVIHTHDDSGVIHIESPANRTYTLGQLFDVWGVRFTSTCLGGDCNEGDRRVRIYADGTLLRRDPRLLILGRHQEIVVSYGTASQVPKPVPSRYGFPLGA